MVEFFQPSFVPRCIYFSIILPTPLQKFLLLYHPVRLLVALISNDLTRDSPDIGKSKNCQELPGSVGRAFGWREWSARNFARAAYLVKGLRLSSRVADETGANVAR